ncbi:MAG: hypothetical protein RLZZ628_557 [Bacteroidota bacterium]|jgi:hypothetical protein
MRLLYKTLVFSENGVAFLYTKFAEDHRFENFLCLF